MSLCHVYGHMTRVGKNQGPFYNYSAGVKYSSVMHFLTVSCYLCRKCVLNVTLERPCTALDFELDGVMVHL